MTDTELLEKVKNGLGITGDGQDATLSVYIQSVKDYMSDAGVSDETLATDKIVGAVIVGVNDLWNYNSGNGNFSPFFKQRVIQLTQNEES